MIKLYTYQEDAVKKMKNGCILCGGVGSGKSRTALAYYFYSHDKCFSNSIDTPLKDLYIITTARKRDTLEWDGELVYFLLSAKSENNYYNNNVVIDSWHNIKKYKEIKNAFFIFDEQRVVGSGSWVKCFLEITKNNKWILLSATPGDTWTDYIPVFVANGFYKNRSEFIREHIVYKNFSKFRQVDRYLNTCRLIRLRNKILVNMDFERKTKGHNIDVYAEYDIRAYKDIVKNRWNFWKDKPIENAGEYCYALRRIANSHNSRKSIISEIYSKHPRMIIFYNFDYELDILKSIDYDFDTEIAEWNGHKHQPIPESKKWVYFVQYNAGAEGWNCIKTDTVVFYSQNYSYKVIAQACGRIDRLNTPYTDLYYYHIKTRAPIDLAISRALKAKKKFNETSFARGKFL